MPIVYEEEGERLADQTPCAAIRAELKMCLLDSDCCAKVTIMLSPEIIQERFIPKNNALLFRTVPKNANGLYESPRSNRAGSLLPVKNRTFLL